MREKIEVASEGRGAMHPPHVVALITKSRRWSFPEDVLFFEPEGESTRKG